MVGPSYQLCVPRMNNRYVSVRWSLTFEKFQPKASKEGENYILFFENPGIDEKVFEMV